MKLECKVCPRRCRLKEGQLGICRSRKMVDGKIISIGYGWVTSMALDPIEKKPLYRFMPGSNILSIGGFGCNFRCDFCQNYTISMSDGEDIEKIYITPEEIAIKAEELKDQGNIGVAYTYNEPLINYEYILDCSKEVHKRNMKNILVTNGYIEHKIFRKVLKYIDAVNIDLKSFNEEFYKKIGGDLEIVKENIKIAAENSNLELTTLVIPNLNDSREEVEELAKWISEIDYGIPLHISRFFPAYKMYDKLPTPVEKIYELVDIGKRHLKYVYSGNC